MAKKQRKNKLHPLEKKVGRSWGPLVVDPVLGDTITQKKFAARKSNNPDKYN